MLPGLTPWARFCRRFAAKSIHSQLLRGGECSVANLSVGQVVSRIHCAIVDPDFVVQMRGGAAAGSSNIADHLILFDPLPDLHRETGQVTKPCRQAATVFDDNEVAVGGFPLRVDDLPVGGGTDLGSKQSGDIHTQVNLSLSTERISPVAVVARERTFHRPYRRRGPAN